MKKTFLIFLLSFLLPGAGLACLGKWKMASVNLGIVLLVGVAAASLLPDKILKKYGGAIGAGCTDGSAAFAQTIAKQDENQSKRGER